MSEKEGKKSFKDTLNLPKTDFSLRANAALKEPELLKRWKEENLDEKTYSQSEKKKKFILHDGPPYANGHLHMGHTFNKIFKDIICKSRRMSGYDTPLKPGWDCHGLPIEFKVRAELQKEKKAEVSREEFKKACREYANKWIDVQREEFKELGVLANWEHPYITMAPSYEASILQVFAKFVDGGYIERKEKTVPWCHHCQTVLAAAEIEYEDRKDPSCYIFFPLENSNLFSNIDKEIGFLVWTTTPWTIPLNRAVVLKPGAKYILLEGKDNKAFIVGEALADVVCKELGIEKKVLAEISSEKLKGAKAHHPFVEGLQIPLLLDHVVTLEEGTACMHMAPGCGPEDYLLATANDIEIFSPLSPDGKYTQGIAPKELEGMSIGDGQIWVIKKLAELGRLIHKTSIRHSYPHCWRCKKGLMFRATEQWFCNLKKNDLLEKTIKEISKIDFGTERSESRFRATVGNRAEWCISRQKIWGVPIPAVLCSKCGHAYLDARFIEKVADGVAKEGIEFWDKLEAKDLVAKDLVSDDFKCGKCGNDDIEHFNLERDILDVWFDSGISHYAVLKKYKELGFPADIYLEGSDQHRGWFQSSLLSSMVINGTTPTKSIITHGFIVDDKGRKMSKSLGNVKTQVELIKKYSRDIVRLWVTCCDYNNDMVVSEVVMKNAAEVYRKIRNTSRFMLSNLFDLDVKKDLVAISDMLGIDQYALARLHEVEKTIREAYEQNNMIAFFKTLGNYCTNDLSSFYLDIAKDRLYTDKKDGIERRSAQTVCYHILDVLTRLMAPVLSFLAEEVSDFYQKDKKESIHLQQFVEASDVWELLLADQVQKGKMGVAPAYGVKEGTKIASFKMQKAAEWNTLQELRDVVMKALEGKRTECLIKHSLEAKVQLLLDPKEEKGALILNFFKNLQKPDNKDRFFKDLFIVSQCEIVENDQGLEKTEVTWIAIKVEHAEGVKCPRCWQWSISNNPDELCKRCVDIV